MDKQSFVQGYMTKQAAIDPEYLQNLDPSYSVKDMMAGAFGPIGGGVRGYVGGREAQEHGFTPEDVGHPGWRSAGSAAAYAVGGGMLGKAVGKLSDNPRIQMAAQGLGAFAGAGYGIHSARQNLYKRLLKKFRERQIV